MSCGLIQRLRARLGLGDWLWNIRNVRVPEPTDNGGKNVKIVVFQHNDQKLPSIFDNRDIYVPLRLGVAISPTKLTNILTDGVGVNISRYNEYINEMTGIFWIGEHYDEIGNPDYIGVDHYRRLLQWSPEMLRLGTVISTSGFYLHKLADDNQHYRTNDVRDRLESRFMSVFDKETYRAYGQTHTLYYSNLFIMDRATFFRYYEFIRKCIMLSIEMIDANEIPMDGYSNYERRLYSFFLERATSYWLFKEKRARNIQLVNTRITYIDIPNFVNSVR